MEDVSTPCKLCDGATHHKFFKTILGRHVAEYVLCSDCGCLQVVSTPWLAEAYAGESWATDTGLVARNLQLAGKICTFLGNACTASDLIVDFGGGTGLLTRLLRDNGWSVICHEPYRAPLFVKAFHVKQLDGLTPSVVIASEVFEHFDSPRTSLAQLFSLAPIIIFTTELYCGQDSEWWYLAPASGQHIFFFSSMALQVVAQGNGYDFIDTGFLKYFVRRRLAANQPLARRILTGIREAATQEASVSALIPYLRDPYKHVGNDHQAELVAAQSGGAGK